MRIYVLLCSCAVVMLHGSVANSADSHVPIATLQQIGLGGMERLSDAEGTTIRGMSVRSALARGIDTISIIVRDPRTGSHVLAITSNAVLSTDDDITPRVQVRHGSTGITPLLVNGPTPGLIIGGSGGSARARAN